GGTWDHVEDVTAGGSARRGGLLADAPVGRRLLGAGEIPAERERTGGGGAALGVAMPAVRIEVRAGAIFERGIAEGIDQGLAIDRGLGVQPTQGKQVIDLVFRAGAVIVVAIELPRPAAEGVDVGFLTVAVLAFVEVRHDVVVLLRLPGLVDPGGGEGGSRLGEASLG